MVASLWLTMVTLGELMKTVRLLVPLTLYIAAWVTPVHVRFGLVQLNTPTREMATVAPDQVPGPSTTEPRSRSWSQVRISGLTTLACTVTDGAARAGAAASRADAASTIAVKPLRAR